jgi:uncharacterized membrane protein YiaA
VVGVTGHRDLAAEEIPKIVESVRELFLMLRRSYPHTPIVLLSSLAEGADRLVAHSALDCGAELYTVLPMEIELYQSDFTSPGSLDEFSELIGRSFGSMVAPTGDRHDALAARTPGYARNLLYAAAGAFVASHSEILIALWDGNEDEMPGGTSQIVRFALQGVPAKYLAGARSALRVKETGAVYHVPVARKSAKLSRVADRAAWRFPEAEISGHIAADVAHAAFEENLRNLDRFNRDSTAVAIEHQAALSADCLLTSQEEMSLNVNGALNYSRALFGQADALAVRCRNWTHRATIAIFGSIAIAAILFSLFTNVFPTTPALYFAFLSFVAAAFGIDLAIIRKRVQDRFQDYRALAEGLRVQFYWRLAGIRESVYDHYFARQEGELDWMRNAMRAVRFRRQIEPEISVPEHDDQRLLEIVLKRWINTQAEYFSTAVQRERELARRIKWGANACLVVTGLVAVTLAVYVAEHNLAGRGIFVATLTLALAGAGLFTGYAQERAHDAHARRYEHMYALYKIAGVRLATLLGEHDVTAARCVLVALGREALAETCDWLLLHRERQIEVPTG